MGFWAVVALRFLVPLAIPRYPLPGIVAALVIDAADQTIFQRLGIPATGGYQSYDKALDVYYLTIAYVSTLRNWANPLAFEVVRFLFYYRLLGVVLFEYTEARSLLLIFPNTFEYYFLLWEAVWMAWDPRRAGRRALLGTAAFIWVGIKIPQEYWIHIAQLDTTDFIKESIFGAPAETPWRELVAARPGAFVAVGLGLALLLAGAWWLAKRKLPQPDWPPSFDVDAHRDVLAPADLAAAEAAERSRLLSRSLAEKIVLISLIGLIFANVLPDVRSTPLQLVVGSAIVVTANAAISHWLARRGHDWPSILREFVVMSAVNTGLIIVYAFLMPRLDGSIDFVNTLFFALLLTLMVTLYDRWRPVHAARALAERRARRERARTR